MYHINVWRMTERNKERTHGCALRGKLGKNKVFLPHWFVCMHVLWLYLCGCVFRELFSLPVRVWSGSRASAKICLAAGQALCFTPDTHRNHPLPWPNATEHTTCMCTLLVDKTCLPLPLSWSPAYFVHVLECVYSHVRTVYLHVRVPSSSNFNTSTTCLAVRGQYYFDAFWLFSVQERTNPCTCTHASTYIQLKYAEGFE